MKQVLLFQIDGKIPNFALMRLSTWHKGKGDQTIFSNTFSECPSAPDVVYSSSIFDTSYERRRVMKEKFPDAITGGDGYFPIWRDLTVIGKDKGSNLREVITDCDPNFLKPDYSLYPSFAPSIGYSQRGCRLDCGFCRMKTREGDARSVAGLYDIWRGEGHPKHIHLLDNDFFGQQNWEEFLTEAIQGKFKICFNQGINVRLISPRQAQMLSRVFYSSDDFKQRRLYTAWDSQKDEKIFKDKILMLREMGIPSRKIMVYMLVGFDVKTSKADTRPFREQEPEILHRFNELVNLGCKPYPMVFDSTNKPLKIFQRWGIRRYYTVCKWEEFDSIVKWKKENPVEDLPSPSPSDIIPLVNQP